MNFNSIEEVLEQYKNGKMIIVVDDEDRENEGDFVIAGDLATAAANGVLASRASSGAASLYCELQL